MSRVWRTVSAIALVLVVLAAAVVVLVHERPIALATERVRYHLWRSGAQSRYVTVDGYRLHYYELAPPNGAAGTPLLLVHGLGARSEDWSPMMPGFAASGFHVYAIDLLGYGRSAKPDVDFGIRLEERIVADFMRALKIEGADVAGWSMGGWVSMALALDHPETVRRLVLYDSAGVYFELPSGGSVFTPVDAEGVNRLLGLLMPKPPSLPQFVMRDVVRTLGTNAWVVHRSVAAMTSGQDLLDFRLHSLDVPTLIVWGEQDRLIPLSAGIAMHKLIAGSVLAVEPGCGHLAPAQCSLPILKETIRFLRADPTVRGGEVRLEPATGDLFGMR